MKDDKTKHEYLVRVKTQTKNKEIQALVGHVFIDQHFFHFLECKNQEVSQDCGAEVFQLK